MLSERYNVSSFKELTVKQRVEILQCLNNMVLDELNDIAYFDDSLISVLVSLRSVRQYGFVWQQSDVSPEIR